jgi:hypothetical protein
MGTGIESPPVLDVEKIGGFHLSAVLSELILKPARLFLEILRFSMSWVLQLHDVLLCP